MTRYRVTFKFEIGFQTITIPKKCSILSAHKVGDRCWFEAGMADQSAGDEKALLWIFHDPVVETTTLKHIETIWTETLNYYIYLERKQAWQN